MAAPDYVFTNIATARIDAESPGDETLFEDLADNDRHLEQWLGDAYTPAKDHDHDGVNSKQAQLPEYHWLRNRGSTTGTTTWSSNQTLTPGIHDYGNLTIQTGVTVSPSGSEAGPLIIRCNGTFTMEGTAKIDWDYMGGGGGGRTSLDAHGGLWLGGGGGGGGGGAGTSAFKLGGKGAQPVESSMFDGLGDYDTANGDNGAAAPATDMRTLASKLAAFFGGGGGGGAGGGTPGAGVGGTGGKGGGLVIIIANTINIGASATIDARGDAGGNGASGDHGGGGGGGGGAIILAASTFTADSGTYTVSAGAGGTGFGTGGDGGDGGAGYKQSITIT